jgi:HPt (histidine-containing phosphotransfer) domain-containing protein
MAQTDSIDYAVLDGVLESVGGDREFLVELIQTYLDDSPRLLEAMRAALVAGDPGEFRRAAHSLKSNSASLGAIPLSQMARELEEMGKAGSLEAATSRLAQAEVEYANVQAAFRAIGS